MSKAEAYPIVDTEFLIQFFRELEKDGETDILAQLIDRFLKTVPDKIKLVQLAIESEDLIIIRYEAHSLSGRAANLGAKALVQICSRLEAAAKKSSLQEIRDLYLELTEEFDRARKVLQEKFDLLQMGVKSLNA